MKSASLLGTLLALSLLLSGCPKKQIQSQPLPGAVSSVSGGGVRTYSHNAQGLEQQFKPFLDASSSGDSAAADRQFAMFALPDASAWFAKYFAKERVEQLGWDYEAEVPVYEKSILTIMTLFPKGSHFTAHCRAPKRTSSVKFAPRTDAMMPLVEVPVEQFEIEYVSDRGQKFSELANLVYVDGAYRYVGKGAYPFWSMPDASSPAKP
jgi:hypothetical protein